MKADWIFAVMGWSFLTVSCTKDLSGPDNMFPNQVGYQWTYSIQNNQDTAMVAVRVVGEGTLPDGARAKIWKYTYTYGSSIYIDTAWVSEQNYNIIFYDKPCPTCTNPMPNERMRFVMPLHTGNFWAMEAFYGDTTKVLQEMDVTVNAGSFSHVFCISHTKGYVTNSWTRDTLYFKNRVGIVKFFQEEYNLGPNIGNGTWELMSDTLRPQP